MPPTHPHRFTAVDTAGLALVIVAGVLVHGWIVLAPNAVMGFTDALDYLLLADHFRAMLYTPDGSSQAAAFFASTRYPPLYPLLLGLLGGGTAHQDTAMAISNGTAILAAVAVWLWARGAFGTLSATLIALALLLYPIHFVLNFHTVSEPFSLALIALVLLMVARRPLGTRTLWLATALLALAPLVRAAAIPLVPAVMLALLVTRAAPLPRILLVGAVALAPSFLWFFVRPLFGAEPYTASLDLHFMLERAGGWPDALWLQPWRLLTAFFANWGSPGSAISFAMGLLLAAATAVGCVDRARKGHADAWFLAGYLALVVIWPYPAEFQRLLTPAYPFILGCALHALTVATAASGKAAASLSGINRAYASAAVVTLAIVLAQGAASIRFVHRAGMEIDPDLVTDKRRIEYFTMASDSDAIRQAEKYARIRGVVDALDHAVPPGDCVFAADPRLLLTRTRVRALSFPPGMTSVAEAQKALSGCDHFFVWSFGMRELGIPPEYPLAQLEGWARPVLMSKQEVAGREVLVAALFARTPSD